MRINLLIISIFFFGSSYFSQIVEYGQELNRDYYKTYLLKYLTNPIPTNQTFSSINEEKRKYSINTKFFNGIEDYSKKEPQPHEEFLLPYSKSKNLIHHSYFSLSYSEGDEQSIWVAYKLTKWNYLNNVERTNNYREDPKINSKSSNRNDYRKSGYDKGHLAPANAMSHNFIAMSESFYMSNISPQVPAFNRGIWKRLEEKIQYWAEINDSLYVVTGPVLSKPLKSIGNNEVTVPNAFYKTIISFNDDKIEGIAFLLPNSQSEESIYKFVVSIDDIENLTGIDFYYKCPEKIKKRVEANKDLRKWLSF